MNDETFVVGLAPVNRHVFSGQSCFSSGSAAAAHDRVHLCCGFVDRRAPARRSADAFPNASTRWNRSRGWYRCSRQDDKVSLSRHRLRLSPCIARVSCSPLNYTMDGIFTCNVIDVQSRSSAVWSRDAMYSSWWIMLSTFHAEIYTGVWPTSWILFSNAFFRTWFQRI